MPLQQSPIPLAGNPLNRASEKRLEPGFFEKALKSPDAFLLPFHKSRVFTLPPDPSLGRKELELGFILPGMLQGEIDKGATCIFLGLDSKDQPYFALDLSDGPDPRRGAPLGDMGKFMDMRSMAGQIPDGDLAILAQGQMVLEWHQRHKYCGSCGTETIIAEAGYKRECPGCELEHFPRTDPVVIMLVEKDGKALLGRGAQFPAGMFSALAGFIEPGESIEEAVAREVMEEVGVDVSHVRYFATQPWPQPYSLMIGCVATATTEDITVDDVELAEARWFTKAELRIALEGKSTDFWVPPAMAIAHHLIKDFAYS